MGLHYMPIPPNVGNDYNCSNSMMFPFIQVLYSGGALTGFLFAHFAELPSNRYEDPHELLDVGIRGIPLTVDGPPQCFLDLADQHKVRSMHVWLGDYLVQCESPEKRETYDVPIVPVENDPFQALYQYPMEGNGLKKSDDGTKVFWPANQKMYSKFYLNLANDEETLFGISEQIFTGLFT